MPRDVRHLVFDGLRELSGVGCVAPDGRLGPWAGLLRRAGLEPRSTGVAAVFVGYGVALAGALVFYLTGSPVGAVVLVTVAALGLWYLPFGTIGCLAVIGLVLWDLLTR